MGYSCTVKADKTFQMTINTANGKNTWEYNGGNTWEVSGQKFFFERGRENADGAVTGSVYKFVGETTCQKYGSVKISAEGKVIKWAGMPKKFWIEKAPMFEVIND